MCLTQARARRSTARPPELLFLCRAPDGSRLGESEERLKVLCVLSDSLCCIWQSTASLQVIPRAQHSPRSEKDLFFFPHSCQPPRSNTTGLNWHVPVTPVRLCLCSFVDWLTCWIRSRAHEVAGNLPLLPHRSHNALLFWVFLWFMLIAAPELMLKTKNGLKKNWEQAGVQKSMLKS